MDDLEDKPTEPISKDATVDEIQSAEVKLTAEDKKDIRNLGVAVLVCLLFLGFCNRSAPTSNTNMASGSSDNSAATDAVKYCSSISGITNQSKQTIASFVTKSSMSSISFQEAYISKSNHCVVVLDTPKGPLRCTSIQITVEGIATMLANITNTLECFY